MNEDGHGRHEERSVSVIYEPVGLPPDWPDVAAVVSVLRERAVGAEVTTTVHFDIANHAGTAAEVVGLIRGHRCIESMHGILDVVFREDDNRVRAGHAGENLALMRRVAVPLLRRAPGKGSPPTKRLKAGRHAAGPSKGASDNVGSETEDYRVDLTGVTVLGLTISPDIAGGIRWPRWPKCASRSRRGRRPGSFHRGGVSRTTGLRHSPTFLPVPPVCPVRATCHNLISQSRILFCERGPGSEMSRKGIS